MSTSNTSTTKPDYGLDAPGLLQFFATAGAMAFLACLATLGFSHPLAVLEIGVRSLFGVAAVYFLGMTCLMIYGSRVMKLKDRDALLNRLTWTGREQVLDIGCGRGLMLVGVAQRLTTGAATGIDLWHQKDQARNTADAAMANAMLEGVADRIKIETADMRQLPFADAQFDVVTSSWTIHNLDAVADRQLALREIIRVLKPGGRLLLIDIVYQEEYADFLKNNGMDQVALHNHPFRDSLLKAVSFGSFAPAAIMARKA